MCSSKRAIIMLVVVMAVFSLATDQAGARAKPNPLSNVYFGEQHLHTQDSPDTFAMGAWDTVGDAYDFAKGKPINKSTRGEIVRRKPPAIANGLSKK